MDEHVISINVPNTVSIAVMGFITYSLLNLASSFWQRAKAVPTGA
jgi:hypothetical protein